MSFRYTDKTETIHTEPRESSEFLRSETQYSVSATDLIALKHMYKKQKIQKGSHFKSRRGGGSLECVWEKRS